MDFISLDNVIADVNFIVLGSVCRCYVYSGSRFSGLLLFIAYFLPVGSSGDMTITSAMIVTAATYVVKTQGQRFAQVSTTKELLHVFATVFLQRLALLLMAHILLTYYRYKVQERSLKTETV